MCSTQNLQQNQTLLFCRILQNLAKRFAMSVSSRRRCPRSARAILYTSKKPQEPRDSWYSCNTFDMENEQCAYPWKNLYLSFDVQVFASRPDALPEAYQKEGSIEMIS